MYKLFTKLKKFVFKAGRYYVECQCPFFAQIKDQASDHGWSLPSALHYT